jgi:hypothetical protein
VGEVRNLCIILTERVEKLIEIYRRRLEEYEMCNVRAVECDLKA